MMAGIGLNIINGNVVVRGTDVQTRDKMFDRTPPPGVGGAARRTSWRELVN